MIIMSFMALYYSYLLVFFPLDVHVSNFQLEFLIIAHPLKMALMSSLRAPTAVEESMACSGSLIETA